MLRKIIHQQNKDLVDLWNRIIDINISNVKSVNEVLIHYYTIETIDVNSGHMMVKVSSVQAHLTSIAPLYDALLNTFIEIANVAKLTKSDERQILRNFVLISNVYSNNMKSFEENPSGFYAKFLAPIRFYLKKDDYVRGRYFFLF